MGFLYLTMAVEKPGVCFGSDCCLPLLGLGDVAALVYPAWLDPLPQVGW